MRADDSQTEFKIRVVNLFDNFMFFKERKITSVPMQSAQLLHKETNSDHELYSMK